MLTRPRHIAAHAAVAGHVQGHARGMAVALDVVDRHPTIRCTPARDLARRCLQQVLARLDASEVLRGAHHVDTAVTEHA